MSTRSASRQASAAGPRSLPCQQQTLVSTHPGSLDRTDRRRRWGRRFTDGGGTRTMMA